MHDTAAPSLSTADRPRTFYPPIESYDSGLLDVGDGQRIYWETCGNPDGIPAVFVHGGPGGGCSPEHRRCFDPARYRIILFDQRGCGRSLPHAWEPNADLSTNTTWHLVTDMERLREHLGIESWLVFGGSWGSTLALAYAERHPSHVLALVLRGIFTLRKRELDWFYEGDGADMIWPDEWEAYVAGAGEGAAPGGFIDRYHKLLTDPDPAVHGPAARAWTTWEAATSTLLRDQAYIDEVQDPAFAITFARIENHYFHHAGWMDDGQLIADAHVLAEHGIPGVIVQGRYDVVCPMGTAWALHRAWPQAELHVSAAAGHSFAEPETLSTLITATDQFAALLTAPSGHGGAPRRS
ncbi:prolyl aminopeptidase [Actinomyces succiniciruminis]|uniref:Proline iminopeptidase n=1 Tax=Actinomyces succiniciruminis TaxID=1522002 RepID=A0A1L7RC95_9ACTO|nr:prolyl aminopeptidase [Actinomyces succiniciruminis]CED91521.1 Proline iminopeptidase [Actinomyces succiniciruminis]